MSIEFISIFTKVYAYKISKNTYAYEKMSVIFDFQRC